MWKMNITGRENYAECFVKELFNTEERKMKQFEEKRRQEKLKVC